MSTMFVIFVIIRKNLTYSLSRMYIVVKTNGVKYHQNFSMQILISKNYSELPHYLENNRLSMIKAPAKTILWN